MYSDYINELVTEKHIPGAVLYVSKNKETKVYKEYGSFLNKENIKQPIYKNTLFDVASLTKIMATLPSLLFLASRNELDLDSPVQSFIPQFKHKNILINHLLQHNSGLPADLPYRDRMELRDVINEIMSANLECEPTSKTIYSDLGMILLGKVIENVTSQTLNEFVEENIFKPWGLSETTYLLPIEKKAQAASTEWYKDSYIQGDVHDEKTYQLNGVSGSAGVFSTASDVAKFASFWLYPEKQKIIPTEYLKSATIHKQNNRGLGFEVWSGTGEIASLCEKIWPIGSFGHTGFTGTSVWISPKDELIVVLLTNAVHFGRNTAIKSIRKQLHSLIYSSFIS